jgi:hypothetical protein
MTTTNLAWVHTLEHRFRGNKDAALPRPKYPSSYSLMKQEPEH